MNKRDFLSILEANLSDYPESSVEAVINKYINIFSTLEAKGDSEEAIISRLGDPYIIAKECRSTMKLVEEDPLEEDKENLQTFHSSGSIDFHFISKAKGLLSVFFAKLFRFLSFIFFLILASPIFVLLSVLLIPAFIVCLLGIIIVFCIILMPRYVMLPIISSSAAQLFFSLGTLSLGVVVFILGVLFFRFTISLIKRLTKSLGTSLKGKEAN